MTRPTVPPVDLPTAYRAVELGAILARTAAPGGADALQRALRLLERATVDDRRARTAAARDARSAA